VTSSGKDVGAEVRRALAEQIGADQVDVWFGEAVQLQTHQGRLCVVSENAFRAERLRRRYRHVLESICRERLGLSGEVEFQTRARPADTVGVEAQVAPTSHEILPTSVVAQRDGRDARGAARSDRRMEFVVGEEHRVLLASVEVIFAQPGKANPLYVHGPTGCGKTEFLALLCHEARQRTRLRRIVCVSAERFTSEFLEALNGRGLPLFRRKFRDVEMLLIDDLQFFSGKRQTLVELQNTIDALLRDGKQLVLAADRPPSDLEGFNADLRGRLRGGLVCPLPYPELATRRQIAQRVAQNHGGLPEALVELVAERFEGDPRQVIGAVYRLIALQKALHRPPTVAEATEALADLLCAPRRLVRLADIEAAVCEVFGVQPQQLHAQGRCKATTQPRMIAMWLARKYTRAGLSEIGRYFGRRSHSTVVSAQRQVEQLLNTDGKVLAAHGELPIRDALRRIDAQLRTA
jgi:chromosomal replication initiator protein